MKKKKLLAIIVSLILIVGVSLPISSTQAASLPLGLNFGGLVSLPLPCTCSGNLWIFFAPLWLGNVPSAGPLVYTPGLTILYQNFKIGVPGAWHLGGYLPIPSACRFYVLYTCIPFPAYGLINYTGTS